MSLADYKFEHNSVDFAKDIGEKGIAGLLELMWAAYKNMIAASRGLLANNENQITEEWYACLLVLWKTKNISLVPIMEKTDATSARVKGKKPTIDFAFRSQWETHIYFGAECKIVEEKNNKLRKEYINQGMLRFIKGTYSSKAPVAAMVGYVKKGDPIQIAKEINNDIQKIDGTPSLIKCQHSSEMQYISNHSRSIGISPFGLYHLFFDVK